MKHLHKTPKKSNKSNFRFKSSEGISNITIKKKKKQFHEPDISPFHVYLNLPKIKKETNFIWKKMFGLKRSVKKEKYESCIEHKQNFMKKNRDKNWLNR